MALAQPSRCALRERLARHLTAFWLRRYQQMADAYFAAHPAPPCTWATWQPAQAWQARYHEAMAPHQKMLDRARARVRAMNCAGLL